MKKDMRNKEIKKFTKTDCEQFLSKLKLEKFTISLITEGIRLCVKEEIHHLDLNMNKIYKILSAVHGTIKREIEWKIYTDIKEIDDETKAIVLDYIGNLTNKKLFILLLERYGL